MTTYTFQSLFDFTRTTSGTFVGSNGLIQNTPASVNLLLWTQEFDNAAWNKLNATANANVTTAPDNTATADALVEDTTSGSHLFQQFISYTSGVSYTLSFYVKAGTRSWVQIAFPSAAFTGAPSSYYDLSGAGALGTAGGSPTARTITAVGNGWYRITITATATATAGGNTFIRSATGDNAAVYAGVTSAQAVFIWGAQLQTGSTATDYTRNNGGVFPPRFDYDPVTLQPKGILIEEQRVNLLLQSASFNTGSWLTGNSTVSANVLASPSGAVDADLLTATAGVFSGAATANGLPAVTTATAYTVSAFVKKNNYRYVGLRFNTSTFGGTEQVPFYDFDTDTLSNGSVSGATISRTLLGNGWVRLAMTFTSTTTTGTTQIWLTDSVGATATAKLGGEAVYIWGAQLEAGAFATSYIPTVASQVTRTADQCAIVAPMFAPWYNQSEGSFVGIGSSTQAGAFNVLFEVKDATSAERFGQGVGSGSTLYVIDNGVNQAAINAGTVSANTVAKVAVAIKQNDFAAVINGGSVGTDVSGTVPTVDRILFGNSSANLYLNGHIRSIRYYPTRLTNAQLQALTA